MDLANKIWWTSKARIQAEKRLLSNASQSQFLLFWYSFVSVSASIYYLKFNAGSEYSGISWVVLSVLVLCLSVFINGLSYKERASQIKECYEKLGALYLESKENVNLASLNNRYEEILNLSENHTERDDRMALCYLYLSHNDPTNTETGLSRHPTKYVWFIFATTLIQRFIFIFILYLFPIASFFLMEFFSDCTKTI